MPVLSLSFGELYFYGCRAAFGAGLPWGLAEDTAATAVWLAERGRDPAPMLAAALHGLADGASGTVLKHERQGADMVLAGNAAKPLSALVSGPSAADWWQVMKHDPAARLVVRDTDVPGWILACVAARTGDGGTGDETADGPGDVVITAGEAARPATADVPRAGCASVEPESWAIVQESFRRSLVPSTDASRSAGAGAGLVDTD